MKWKKWIALGLAVCMCMLPGTAALAEDVVTETGSAVGSHTSAINMLDGLDLLAGNVLDGAQPAGTITRAEIAALLLAISGYDTITSGNTFFSDVPESHWAAAKINTACELGYINGYGDGTFRPDAPVTGAELIKMLVGVLGYNQVALSRGGWPTGYMLEGGSLGLLKSVTLVQDQPVTYGQACQAIYNALNVDILKPVSYGGTIKYESYKDVTLLSDRLNLIKQRGTVWAVGETAVRAGMEVREGFVRVDDYLYSCGEMDLVGFVGMAVEFYYYDDETVNDPYIKTMYLSNNAETLAIEANSIDSVGTSGSDYTVSYRNEYDGDEEATVSRYADVIYNGRADSNFSIRDLANLSDGTVTLISSDRGASYDIVRVEEYKSIVIESVDQLSGTVYAKDKTAPIDGSYKLELPVDDKDARITIVDKENIEITLADLREWYVAAVMCSSDRKNVRMVVTNDSVSGMVEEYSEVGSDRYVSINGNTYMVSRNMDISANEIEAGSSGTFYLDAFGKLIAADNTTSDTYHYGYLAQYAKEGGIDESVRFRVFTDQGVLKEYTLSDKLRVNGEPPIRGEQIISNTLLFDGTELKPQLIYFRSNSKDEITAFETAVDLVAETGLGGGYDEDRFSLDYTLSGSKMFRWNSRVIANQYIVSAGVRIFVVPDDPANLGNEESYSLMGIDYFNGDTQDTDGLMLFDSNRYKEVPVIVATASTRAAGEQYTLVNEVKLGVDEEGTEHYKLSGFEGGEEINLLVSPTAEEAAAALQPGDIIRVRKDRGMISGITVIMKVTDWGTDLELSGDINGRGIHARGDVAKKGKNSLTLTINGAESPYVYAITGETRVFVYDTVRKQFRKGTTNDFGEGSRVFVSRRWDAADQIVVLDEH